MNLIGSILFWFLFAFLLAAVEVEAEGKYGWAEKMPTWYRTRGLAGRLYGLVMGGKPLTGYHLFMFFLPLVAVHAGFFLGVRWSLSGELVVLARYFALAVLWDGLWFVLNPAYGIARFRRERVWWHAKSHWVFGRFPIDYLVGWAISLGLALAANKLGAPGAFQEQALLLAGLLLLTFVVIAFAPHYHWWHANMRSRDDRQDAGITHND